VFGPNYFGLIRCHGVTRALGIEHSPMERRKTNTMQASNYRVRIWDLRILEKNAESLEDSGYLGKILMDADYAGSVSTA
jgi:hypothetical protein